MFNKDLLLIDEETSGLDPEKHDLIQLAGILLDRKTLKEKKAFNSYIKPLNWKKRSREAMAVNKISYDQLKNAPSIKEVLKQFNKTFGSKVILSYYVGTNDIMFLKESYKRARLQYPFDYHSFNIWGPMYVYMARKKLLHNKKEFAGFTLEDCAKHFKIRIPEKLHDALVDCRLEAEILRRVIKGK